MADFRFVSDENLRYLLPKLAKKEDIPAVKLTSMDAENPIILRNLDSNVYVLHGYILPYEGSSDLYAAQTPIQAGVAKSSDASFVQLFFPYNNMLQYFEITDSSYTEKVINLNDLITTSQLTEVEDKLEDFVNDYYVAPISQVYPAELSVNSIKELVLFKGASDKDPEYRNDGISTGLVVYDYANATTELDGLMSAEDKVKLEGTDEHFNGFEIMPISEVYPREVNHKSIKELTFRKPSSSERISTNFMAVEYGNANTSEDGLMSAEDKTKLDNLSKSDVGLGNVNNTSDLNKPISTATQAALNLKEDKANLGDLAYKDSLSKSEVGLGNVDNTSDLNKPISTATQAALNTKATKDEMNEFINDFNVVSVSQTYPPEISAKSIKSLRFYKGLSDKEPDYRDDAIDTDLMIIDYDNATSQSAGLMSAADKVKVDNIPTKTSQLINDSGFVNSNGSVASATNATKLNEADTRSVTTAPSGYMSSYSRSVLSEFKGSSVTGLGGTYSSVMTVTPWSDSSGGRPHQLAFNDDGKLYHRYASSDTAWSTWKQLATGTIPTNNNQLTNGAGYITKSNLLTYVYPVGSIYMSINNTSPASFLGGSWTQLGAGYALWTASSGAGGTISAGLPNITGSDNSSFFSGGQDTTTGSGAVRMTKSSNRQYKTDGTSSNRWAELSFNASWSNSIYGASTTVQPPAYKVYAWRRTA